MLTAATVYHEQGALEHARKEYEAAPSPELRADVERRAAEVAELQERIGGVVYRPAVVNLPRLVTRIEQVNRRARKIGAAPVKLALTDERVTLSRTGEDGVPRGVEHAFVVLRGSAPQVAGWWFVAILDHTLAADDDGDARAVIRRVPGHEEVDLTGYRRAEPRCDHCHVYRRRNNTFLLANADGEIRQVGSDCLTDFVGGVDPHQAARQAEWLTEIAAILRHSDDDEDVWQSAMLPLDTYVAYAAALIRQYGFCPRRDPWGEINPRNTADAALDAIAAARRSPHALEVTDSDRQLAAAAIRWAREELGARDDLSEFEHNLATVASCDWLSDRHHGIAAYLPVAYEREQRQREIAVGSQHVGRIGERIKLTLTVTGRHVSDGIYGTRYLNKLSDEEGNRFLWWSSRGLEVGRTYQGTATVKDHGYDRYEGGAAVTELKNFRAKEVAAVAA